MLLTIDIGNTNITMGVFEEEFLLGMFRMTTKRARTSDEYGFTICGILEHRGIDSKRTNVHRLPAFLSIVKCFIPIIAEILRFHNIS